ncbi:MAG: dihydroorotase [Gammaproteobacteria bacterium]|jgi:dihydroorotase
MSILIANARVVNEGQIKEQDVMVVNGRIHQVGNQIAAGERTHVIDAKGKTLMPGMIDDQVHFREPGLTHKADIESESLAAAVGGITSYMEMPNVTPPTTDREALRDKYAIAQERSYANYAFYLGATNDNIDEIRRIKKNEACGVKVFMGASTGNLLVDNHDSLNKIFKDCPLLIATHCEDSPMIGENMMKARAQYGSDVPIEMHPIIRSAEACYKSSSFAVGMAKEHDTRLHVLHLTTAKEMELFTAGPVKGKRITAEVCAHHLFFDSDDYAAKGNLIKCNPAIKKPTDRDAIWKALLEDRIDVIATDNAPHLLEEKAEKYDKAPAGLPLVQFALPSLLEHVYNGKLTIEQLVHKTSHAVAQCYGVSERGYIREGYWADLVLVDMDKHNPIRNEQSLSKCGWTPFDGYDFHTQITHSIVSGQLILADGEIDRGVSGYRLDFV